jgi:D-amino-acid dehydrogenase
VTGSPAVATVGTSIPHPRPQRIAVIGAGVVGLACALHLRRAGLSVDIYDMRAPGEGASLGNAGIIAVCEVLPIGRPGILRQVPRMMLSPTGPLSIKASYLPSIAPWLVRMLLASRPSEVTRLSLHLASVLALASSAWSDLIEGSAARRLLMTNGWLKAYETPSAFAKALMDGKKLKALGVNLEVLEAKAVRDLEPSLKGLAGGLFFPQAGNLLSPLSTTRALAEDARQAGIAFHRVEVARLAGSAHAPRIADAEGNETSYESVVIAAGAWSRRLLRTLGVDLPLDTERGYHLMLPTPERSLTRPVSLPTPGYTLAQMEDGLRLTTGVEFAGLDAPPDYRRVLRMARHARTLLPGLAEQPISKWLGFRPSMPDSIPVIGALRRYPAVVLALGHGHLGVTLGPLTGQIVAAMIAGRALPLDATPFSPSRFGM